MMLLIQLGGLAILLLAFVLGQARVWDQHGIAYDIANCIGSFLLAIYAWYIGEAAFIVLNSVWCFFSLHDIFAHILKRPERKFNVLKVKYHKPLRV
jgi:hypothetical protein